VTRWGGRLITGVVLDRNVPPDTTVHFFHEDAGE
jgi:hypothetical protein